MIKVVRLLSVAVLAFSLTACGKSKEEKAQDRAKADIEEQHRLAGEINAAGIPSAYWSDEQLNNLENKLLQLEQVESRLAAANGKNGVTVYGGDNGRMISQRRQMIASARAEKARSKSAAAPGTLPNTAVGVQKKDLGERLQDLVNAGQPLAKEYESCAFVGSNSTAQELKRCINLSEQLERNFTEMRQVYTEIQSSSLPIEIREVSRKAIGPLESTVSDMKAQRAEWLVLLAKKEQAS